MTTSRPYGAFVAALLLVAAPARAFDQISGSMVSPKATSTPGQAILGLQAANAAMLRATVVLPGAVVRRAGYAAAGDGGGADYVGTASPCPTDDGGTCLNAPGGSWRIDWASVGNVASVALFGSMGAGNLAVDTSAIQAALNTGKDAYLPLGQSGQYFWTAGTTPATAITYKAVNQRVFGPASGQVTIGCYLVAAPGTTNPCLNTNGLQGVRFDGFGMYYPGVPDTTSTADKGPYGPLIYAQGSAQMRSTDILLTRANVDIDLRGNTGGSTFTDEKFSCFSVCHQIDGSLDTEAWFNPHGFVYYLTANETTVFQTNATGWDVGRMDDFRIHGGLYIGALAFSFHNNVQTASPGSVFGGVTNFDCDTFSCINMSAGTIQAANLTSTLGSPGSYTAIVNGGILTLGNPLIGISATISAAVAVGTGGTVNVDGGSTAYNGPYAGSFDASAYIANGGTLDIAHHYFSRPPGTTANPACTSNPIIGQAAATSRITAIGLRISDIGTGTPGCAAGKNTFIYAPADNFSRIIGNVAPGWTNGFPASPSSGVYQFN